MPESIRQSARPAPRFRAPRRRRAGLRGALTSLCVVCIGVLAGVLSAGGTYALWGDDASIMGATITSGILDLDVSGSPDSAHWSKLLPGEHHVQFVTVENTGNIPLALSGLAAQSGGDSGSFEVRLELVSGAADCSPQLSGADALGNPVTLGTMPAASVARLCVDVSLADSALPGHEAQFSLTLTADQGS